MNLIIQPSAEGTYRMYVRDSAGKQRIKYVAEDRSEMLELVQFHHRDQLPEMDEFAEFDGFEGFDD